MGDLGPRKYSPRRSVHTRSSEVFLLQKIIPIKQRYFIHNLVR